jgi:hypothetical protein
MLKRVSATDDVSISVGQQEVTITRGAEVVRERKVTLPDRWVRGFAEAAVFQSRMERVLRLPAAQARRLLSSLPTGGQTYRIVRNSLSRWLFGVRKLCFEKALRL